GDEDVVGRRQGVQLVADLADVAAEALDRLDAQVAGGFDGRAGQGRQLDVRELQELLEGPRDREQPGQVGDAFEVVFALFVQVVGLDQHGPRTGRQIVAE